MIKMNLQLPKIKGNISLLVNKANGSEVSRKQCNVITDVAWNRIFNVDAQEDLGALFNLIAVGTGQTTLTRASTDLTTLLGTRAGTPTTRTLALTDVAGTNYYVLTLTRTFTRGSIVGDVGEVGCYRIDSVGQLVSGQRIETGGTPDPVTVDAEDELTVTYDILLPAPTLPEQVATGSVTIDSTTYNYTVNLTADFVRVDEVNAKYFLNLPRPGIDTAAGDTVFYNAGTAATASDQVITRVSDVPNNTATWNIVAQIEPSEGTISIGDMGFGYGYSDAALGNGANSMMNIDFDVAVPKDNTERFQLDIDLTVGWT